MSDQVQGMDDVPASRPYINDADELVVPADCDPQYRWWTGEGLKLSKILIELKVSRTVWEKYSPEEYPEELQKENYPLLGGE